MPRTKLDKPQDPYERYRGLLLGRMHVLGIGAELLSVKVGVSEPTMRKYIKEPGMMRLDTMRKLNRVLDIESEQARSLLPLK